MYSSKKSYSFLYVLANCLIVFLLSVQFMLLNNSLRGFGILNLIATIAFILAILYLLLLQIVFIMKNSLPVFLFSVFRQAWALNSLLLPIIIKLGNLFGQSRDQVMRSFVNVANGLNAASSPVKPCKVLILLPHCVQNTDCKIRVTSNPKDCVRCGRCKIAAVLDLAEKYGVNFAVATGGTLARKIIRDTKPAVVLAVACERDLVAGLKDVFPLPAFGLLNERPNGPCYNTDLDVVELEKQLIKFLGTEMTGVRI